MSDKNSIDPSARGPRVLFVSKAVVPPFHDGSINLVRFLSQALLNARPSVLSTKNAPAVAPFVQTFPVYRKHSRFSPALLDNVRVLLHLLHESDHDIWHFVFAPNPKSSTAGKIVKTIRKRPVVQTVASRPHSFSSAKSLLFGDRVIALSKHTADRLIQNGANVPITVIAPPVADCSRNKDQQNQARQQANIDPHADLILYAGDLEFSSGAQAMANAVPLVLREAPNAVVAFACRAKTTRAAQRKEALEAQLKSFGSRVRFVGEVADLPALIASACALPFPVDDLYGKVDHPYVVLESALLQVPVLVPKGGPLEEIQGIPTLRGGDIHTLAGWCVEMVKDERARQQVGAALRNTVLTQHNPATVAAAVASVYEDLLSIRRL